MDSHKRDHRIMSRLLEYKDQAAALNNRDNNQHRDNIIINKDKKIRTIGYFHLPRLTIGRFILWIGMYWTS